MNASAIQRSGSNGALKGGFIVFGGAAALVLMAVGARYCLERGLTWTCPSMLILGLPCPSCGGTRALAALAQFDLLQAIRFNPFMVISLAALVIVPFKKLRRENWSRRTWAIIGTLFLLNWVYLLLYLPRV